MKMDANKFFDENAEKKEEIVPKKVLKRNWEIAACAFLFGVAMILIGVFL